MTDGPDRSHGPEQVRQIRLTHFTQAPLPHLTGTRRPPTRDHRLEPVRLLLRERSSSLHPDRERQVLGPSRPERPLVGDDRLDVLRELIADPGRHRRIDEHGPAGRQHIAVRLELWRGPAVRDHVPFDLSVQVVELALAVPPRGLLRVGAYAVADDDEALGVEVVQVRDVRRDRGDLRGRREPIGLLLEELVVDRARVPGDLVRDVAGAEDDAGHPGAHVLERWARAGRARSRDDARHLRCDTSGDVARVAADERVLPVARRFAQAVPARVRRPPLPLGFLAGAGAAVDLAVLAPLVAPAAAGVDGHGPPLRARPPPARAPSRGRRSARGTGKSSDPSSHTEP